MPKHDELQETCRICGALGPLRTDPLTFNRDYECENADEHAAIRARETRKPASRSGSSLPA